MLQINNLKKAFNIGTSYENSIFSNFSLEVEDNTSLAIIGTNGCGKSTLMNLIAGSLKNDGGSIIIDGEDLSKMSERQRSKYLGRVFQDPSKGVCPSLSILENMALADNKNKKFSLGRLVNKNRIDYYKDLLRPLNLGLENMLDRRVSLLSGGQRQSLSLVMASMNLPKLMLLDEHTASLDPKTSRTVMMKTRELIKDKKITTIMITHNMADAIDYADRVIMLRAGQVVLDKMTKDICREDLENLYKEEFIA